MICILNQGVVFFPEEAKQAEQDWADGFSLQRRLGLFCFLCSWIWLVLLPLIPKHPSVSQALWNEICCFFATEIFRASLLTQWTVSFKQTHLVQSRSPQAYAKPILQKKCWLAKIYFWKDLDKVLKCVFEKKIFPKRLKPDLASVEI